MVEDVEKRRRRREVRGRREKGEMRDEGLAYIDKGKCLDTRILG